MVSVVYAPSMMMESISVTDVNPASTPFMRTGIWADPDTASARSSTTSVTASTPADAATRAATERPSAMVLPPAASMRRSGSKRPICFSARDAKPLNTLSTTTMAITAMAIPPTATPQMILTAEWLLRESR